MHQLKALFLVACGGAIGSSIRYLLSTVLDSPHAVPFSIGTIVVNTIGCFLAGALLARFGATVLEIPLDTRLLVLTGVLGGFTTFSAFSLDVLQAYRTTGIVTALTTIALNVAGSIVAAVFGFWVIDSRIR